LCQTPFALRSNELKHAGVVWAFGCETRPGSSQQNQSADKKDNPAPFQIQIACKPAFLSTGLMYQKCGLCSKG
jgi:hypothetical protein